ncbi:MAG: cardiolipin synthase B [Rhizobacter sp.]|nr:cardiolipin synthase B [Rhizobacter sp.]
MTGEKKLDRRVAHTYALEDPRFANELGVLLGPPFLTGNQPTVLLNGDAIFPAMLGAIDGARRSITFETYIYWSGDIGRKFASALSAAARRGVRTHVLLDWVGSGKMDEALLDDMKAAGVQIKKFHPPHWYDLGRMNNRTHRKLLVVDGVVGFTGGVGIAEEWTGHAQDPNHWRDTHVQIQGPVVAQLQAVFMDNWITVTGELLHGEAYFPELTARGESRAQMFSSSPTGGSDSMQLMYLFSIASAVRTIDLSAAYFVPDDLTREALLAAMKRGVKLRIIVPGEHMDSETVKSASRAQWGLLLEAGALIAEYQPTMFHCKVLIIDGLLVSMGSTNFDNRSFRLNAEATLNILDATVAAEQTAVFEQDLARSRQVSLEMWANRPVREKITDWFASLLSSQL